MPHYSHSTGRKPPRSWHGNTDARRAEEADQRRPADKQQQKEEHMTTVKATQQVPSVGRIVHYRLDSGPNAGEYRPAIVVRVGAVPAGPHAPCQLQVFTDAPNDGLPCPHLATWRQQGEGNGQWIWPPHLPSMEAPLDADDGDADD